MTATANIKFGNALSATLILFAVTSTQLISENKLSVARTSNSQLAVELSNSDPVSGIQFSVNARGSLKLMQLQSGERSTSGRWEIYSYLKNDSTLNVVMLAPYQSSLSNGSGAIVTVTYSNDLTKSTDTNRVFLSRTEIVNPNAQILPLTVSQLAWSATETTEGSSFFSLRQNYPNPFNPSTTIAYRLDKAAQVKLTVYDIAGRQIATLVNQYQFPGQHDVKWESTDDAGQKVPSGMYIARIQVEREVASRKMILTK